MVVALSLHDNQEWILLSLTRLHFGAFCVAFTATLPEAAESDFTPTANRIDCLLLLTEQPVLNG